MMNRLDKKTRFYFFIGICILSILFLILAVCLKVEVRENKTYEDRDHLAMYIIEYRHLPNNYILKEENPYLTRKEAVQNGVSFGGDVFEYRDEITKYTKNTDLREADYYLDREKGRDAGRFIYTASGKFELFYTTDHYDSFTRITAFKINFASNVMWFFFYGTYGYILVIIIKKQMEVNRRKAN